MTTLETRSAAAETFTAQVREGGGEEVNMSPRDRAISAGFGLLSILWATGQNRSLLTRLFCGTTGGFLLQWAATGRCALYEQLGVDSSESSQEQADAGQAEAQPGGEELMVPT